MAEATSFARLDFKDEETRTRLLGQGTVRSSADVKWESLYFEHRKGDRFEIAEHVIAGHYLMVKLNPLSKAERKVDGKIQMEIQRRGATAYIPDGCPHQVRYLTSLGSLHLMALPNEIVERTAEEFGIDQFKGIPHFAYAEDKFVLEVAETIDRELLAGNPHGEIFAQTYAKTLAAHILIRYRRTGVQRPKLPALSCPKLRRLDQYIESGLSYPISLRELAKQVGLSEYYFCRAFKEVTGISPYKYVLQKRIEFACARLQQDNMSIQDIAFAAGFSDPVQFTKQFKRINGITPSAYRASYARKSSILTGS